jgi:hypothetical protein
LAFCGASSFFVAVLSQKRRFGSLSSESNPTKNRVHVFDSVESIVENHSRFSFHQTKNNGPVEKDSTFTKNNGPVEKDSTFTKNNGPVDKDSTFTKIEITANSFTMEKNSHDWYSVCNTTIGGFVAISNIQCHAG